MGRKQILQIVLIAFFVGALGSLFFERFLLPRMSVLPGFEWLSKISVSPVEVVRREEIVLNEGANFIELAKQAANRTVSLYQPTKSYPKFLGNGMILTSDGLIVTTREAVGNNTRLLVVLNDSRSFEGLVRALDPKSELAIVTISAQNLSVAEFSDAYSLQTGQKILALGNGNREYTRKFAAGVITRTVLANGSFEKSFSSETLSDVLETDADLENEFVGGPVIGLNGKIVGLVVNAQGKVLVSEHVRTALASYLQIGKITRPRLGLKYLNVTASMAVVANLPGPGLLVSEIEEGSPAKKAGLFQGDFILEVDGEKLDDKSFEQLLNGHSMSELKLKVSRLGKESTLTVILEPTK